MPIAEIAAIREIAIEFINGLRKAGNAVDRRQIESALRAFKQIYFFDDRTKLILKEVSNGDAPSKEKIEEFYKNFQSTEQSVRFSLESIRTFAEDQKTELSVRVYNKLRSLSDGKWSIRLETDHLFQEMLAQIDSDVVQERSERLLNAISELNRIIEEIDDELRQRVKG